MCVRVCVCMREREDRSDVAIAAAPWLRRRLYPRSRCVSDARALDLRAKVDHFSILDAEVDHSSMLDAKTDDP